MPRQTMLITNLLGDVIFAFLCLCLISCSKKQETAEYEIIDKRKVEFKIEVIDKDVNANKENPPDNYMFVQYIVSNIGRISPFVSVDIESSDYNGKVVVENGDLYWYFRKSRDIDYEEYKKIMYRVLNNKLTLKVTDCDFKCVKSYFNIVPNDKAVIANAKKGVKHFTKTYFKDGKRIKDDLHNKRNAIISQMYDFNIAIDRSCETGYLKIAWCAPSGCPQ